MIVQPRRGSGTTEVGSDAEAGTDKTSESVTWLENAPLSVDVVVEPAVQNGRVKAGTIAVSPPKGQVDKRYAL